MDEELALGWSMSWRYVGRALVNEIGRVLEVD